MKKRFLCVLLAALTAVCAAGCGADPEESDDRRDGNSRKETDSDETETDDEEETDAAAAPGSAQTEDGIAEKLCGCWEYACINEGYSDTDPEDYSLTMADDSDGVIRQLDIYEDEGILYADYVFRDYEWSNSCYHLPVTIEESPLYENCENQEWHAVVAHPEREDLTIRFTLTGEDELTAYESFGTAYGDSGSDAYLIYTTYVREGSEAAAHVDDYRYDTVVEVSTVDELLAAIDDHTKILLNAGEYNLSKAQERKTTESVVFNPSGAAYWKDDIQIRDVHYLCLEAKDGAEVTISIDAPDVPVLQFFNSDNIILEGLTCGHNVPAGGCSGSVIYTSESYHLTINDCRLYGSGTYGLESDSSSLIEVNDSEIYECTYGITWLTDCYSVTFENCKMYDNSASNMITLFSSNSVWFYDCEFRNNFVNEGFGTYSFVYCYNECNYVGFRRCTFRENQYRDFSNDSSVITEDCKFLDP